MQRHVNRAIIRKQRKNHIHKKEKILKSLWGTESYNKYYGSSKFHTGKLSKGKIHCGCFLCKPWKWTKEESVKNLRKVQKANFSLDEYFSDLKGDV